MLTVFARNAEDVDKKRIGSLYQVVRLTLSKETQGGERTMVNELVRYARKIRTESEG